MKNQVDDYIRSVINSSLSTVLRKDNISKEEIQGSIIDLLTDLNQKVDGIDPSLFKEALKKSELNINKEVLRTMRKFKKEIVANISKQLNIKSDLSHKIVSSIEDSQFSYRIGIITSFFIALTLALIYTLLRRNDILISFISEPNFRENFKILYWGGFADTIFFMIVIIIEWMLFKKNTIDNEALHLILGFILVLAIYFGCFIAFKNLVPHLLYPLLLLAQLYIFFFLFILYKVFQKSKDFFKDTIVFPFRMISFTVTLSIIFSHAILNVHGEIDTINDFKKIDKFVSIAVNLDVDENKHWSLNLQDLSQAEIMESTADFKLDSVAEMNNSDADLKISINKKVISTSRIVGEGVIDAIMEKLWEKPETHKIIKYNKINGIIYDSSKVYELSKYL